jgi:hypothetical protein
MTTKKPTSTLGLFNDKLVAFFEDLAATYPEERDIKMALEAIQGAKKINPRLIMDMFYENVTKDLKEAIATEDADKIIAYGRIKIKQQFNEILPALAIFDKHWVTLSDPNRKAIWNYLKVLVSLSEKAQSVRV